MDGSGATSVYVAQVEDLACDNVRHRVIWVEQTDPRTVMKSDVLGDLTCKERSTNFACYVAYMSGVTIIQDFQSVGSFGTDDLIHPLYHSRLSNTR